MSVLCLWGELGCPIPPQPSLKSQNPSVAQHSPVMFPQVLTSNSSSPIPMGLQSESSAWRSVGGRDTSHSNLVGKNINLSHKGGNHQSTAQHTQKPLPQNGAAILRVLNCPIVLFVWFGFVDKISIHSPGWPRSLHSPTSASRMLGLQVGATTLGLDIRSLCFLPKHYTPGF